MLGGETEGRTHEEGGNDCPVKDSDKSYELRRGEFIVMAEALDDPTVRVIKGTNEEIIHYINRQAGGRGKVMGAKELLNFNDKSMKIPEIKALERKENFYHVQFRDPKQFTMIRTPDWAATVADSVSKGAEVRTGKTRGGDWKIQNVLIPTKDHTEAQARDLATDIVQKIEGNTMARGGRIDKEAQKEWVIGNYQERLDYLVERRKKMVELPDDYVSKSWPHRTKQQILIDFDRAIQEQKDLIKKERESKQHGGPIPDWRDEDFLTYAHIEIEEFLHKTLKTTLSPDWTFRYGNKKYQITPMYRYARIAPSSRSMTDAFFPIYDSKGKEVGRIEYHQHQEKERFSAHSDTFNWPGSKFGKGGAINNSPKLRSVKITYDTGDIVHTSMSGKLTDQEIKDYYQIGSTFNIGSGPEDKMAKVEKVEILDDQKAEGTPMGFSEHRTPKYNRGDIVKMFEDEPPLVITDVNIWGDKLPTYDLASEDNIIDRRNISEERIYYFDDNSMQRGGGIYTITGTGLRRAQRLPFELQSNRYYYMGASDDPDLIVVTSISDDWISYRKYPYYKDFKIERRIGEDLINSGIQTYMRRAAEAKDAPEYLRDIYAERISLINRPIPGTLNDIKRGFVLVYGDKSKFKNFAEFEKYLLDKHPWFSISGLDEKDLMAESTGSIGDGKKIAADPHIRKVVVESVPSSVDDPVEYPDKIMWSSVSGMTKEYKESRAYGGEITKSTTTMEKSIDEVGNPTDPSVLNQMNQFIENELDQIDDKDYPTPGMKYKEAKRRFYEQEGYGAYHPKFSSLFDMLGQRREHEEKQKAIAARKKKQSSKKTINRES